MSSEPRTTASPAIIVGRYRVVTLIAHGGMGSLYLAHDPAIDRTIALKLLQKGFDDEAARERFSREARAAGRLRHPNIVTVFDVGEHEDRPFIAMEYVPGETLHQLIRRRTPLSIANKLLILEDLCSGLHFAHTQGIVHRDVKPANVILDVGGTIKILDFGLARASDSAITRAGDQLGTLNYMSPEQLIGAHLDHRSDVYAVGALAYELISYERAFPGNVQDGTLYRILSSTPTSLESPVPDLDPEIARIVERAMAKEPEQRYQSLDDMRQALESVRHRLQDTEAAPALDVAAVADVESSADGSTPLPTPVPVRHSQARALAGVARDSTPLVQALASSAATFALGSRQAVPAPHEPARRRTGVVLLAAASAIAVAVSLAVALYPQASLYRLTRLAGGGSKAPAVQSVTIPVQAPANPAPATEDRGQDRRDLDERLTAIRATARRQIAARQRSQLLDTLNAGLLLNAGDVELNQLIEDVRRSARQGAVQARANAGRRGATEAASLEFRDARAREREGDALDRAGDRGQAIRALWAATDLYDRASGATARHESPSPAPAQAPQPSPPPARVDAPPASAERPSPPPSPTTPPVPDKPAQATLPSQPVGSTSSPSDGGRDGRASDVAAIHETLARYADAYRNRDVAAVRKVLPSLSAQQLRGLEKDFSEYRSYSVELIDPRVSVDRDAAVVTCQITRSFVTKSGVAGGHTVATTLYLRKTDSNWVIERLDSR